MMVATLFVLLAGAGAASAQSLSIAFNDGKVRLKAENVPVSRILAEWTRIGGTRIVHGERVPGALTLEIMDVPERQALDIVLRGAAGYMVLARDMTPAGASSFDKILVLPTTTRAPAAASVPQPSPQTPTPPFPGQNTVEDDDDNQEPFTPPPPGAFPRGRAPNVNRPPGAPLPTQQPAQTQTQPRPQPQQPQDADEDAPADRNEPASPPPGNPFGVVPGGARPGTISPAPPQQQQPQQRQPNAGQQPR
jgi:hypothetical protein